MLGDYFIGSVNLIERVISSFGFWSALIVIYGMYTYHKRWKMKFKLYSAVDKKKMESIDKTSIGKDYKIMKTFFRLKDEE